MPLPQPKHDWKPRPFFKDGFNPRPIVRDTAFAELVDSIREHGILQPIGSLEDGRMLFGNRRLAAGEEAGLPLFPVSLYPASISEGQVVALTLIENLQRQDQTDYQTYLGIKRLVEACPDMQRQEIGKLIGKSSGMVTNYLCPDDLCPEAMEAFKEGKIGITKCYQIKKSDDQLATLALFLGGETRDGAARKTRKAVPVAPGDLAKKIKLPPVGKAAVMVAAEDKAEISLDEALEAVLDAARQIKAAMAKGISARTAAAYFKDIAAAG